MNHKNLFVITAVCLLTTKTCLSQTLEWGSLSGSQIVDRKGDLLESSAFVVELGTFNQDFEPTSSNTGDWILNWHVFDTADYQTDQLTLTGYFTGAENVQNVSNYSTTFEGYQAYMWVRDVDYSEFFLAKDSSWVFPAQDQGCCPSELPIQWSVTDLGDGLPIWGVQSGVKGAGFGSAGNYDLQTLGVPECGSSALVMMSAGAMFLRRRRCD